MHSTGFEPAIPAIKRPQNYIFDSKATGTGSCLHSLSYFCNMPLSLRGGLPNGIAIKILQAFLISDTGYTPSLLTFLDFSTLITLTAAMKCLLQCDVRMRISVLIKALIQEFCSSTVSRIQSCEISTFANSPLSWLITW